MADASFNADVARGRAILANLRPWIDRYRGGMPAGWMASIILHESGGNFGAPGDASLGEVGYMQVAAYVPPLFEYPSGARMEPENNLAIGSLEYALEHALWVKDFVPVQIGSADAWRLARLSFAVGRGGSRTLAAMAAAARGGSLTGGDVYGDILRFVSTSGAPALGSQTPAKVVARVQSIQRQWDLGQAIEAGMAGPPTRIPDPPAGPYTIPADADPYFVKPISGTLLAIGGGLALLVYWITRYT